MDKNNSDEIQILVVGYNYQIENKDKHITMINKPKNIEYDKFNIIVVKKKWQSQITTKDKIVLTYSISELINFNKEKNTFITINYEKYQFEFQIDNKNYQQIFEIITIIAKELYNQIIKKTINFETIKQLVDEKQLSSQMDNHEFVFCLRELIYNIKDYYKAISLGIIKQEDNNIKIKIINNYYIFKYKSYTIKINKENYYDRKLEIFLKVNDIDSYKEISINVTDDNSFRILASQSQIETLTSIAYSLNNIVEPLRKIINKKRVRKE